MLNNIPIENMSYLANSFPLRADVETLADSENIHPTQQTKERIKLQLFFIIPEEGNSLPRLVSVRIPRGVPVAKLRLLIKHIENQLQDTYGKAKRTNFILTCSEDSENWALAFELPTFGVVYV